MKIYLAGKISKNDWRKSIVGAAVDEDNPRKYGRRLGFDPWRIVRDAIFDQHDYTGPFFTSCDHGCAHSSGVHGNSDHDCFMENEARLKDYVAEQVQLAIKHSDLVFAWLDEFDALGTFWELGFARGLGIRTVVALGPMLQHREDLSAFLAKSGTTSFAREEHDDLWLVKRCATTVIRDIRQPHKALKAVLDGSLIGVPA
jgi:hypothetical protein